MQALRLGSHDVCLTRAGECEKREIFLSPLWQRNRLSQPHTSNTARLNEPLDFNRNQIGLKLKRAL